MRAFFASCCIATAVMAGEPTTLTLTPVQREGDVARCNVLATMSMQMPSLGKLDEYANVLITSSMDTTWTVRSVTDAYNVIVQSADKPIVSAVPADNMMARLMSSASQLRATTLELRVSKTGQIEDVLNGGEVLEHFSKMQSEASDFMNAELKRTQADAVRNKENHPAALDTNKMIEEALKRTIDSPALREAALNNFIGQDIFPAAWVWGKTLTVGKPITETITLPASQVGASGPATRVVELVSVNEHDIQVRWTTTTSIDMKAATRNLSRVAGLSKDVQKEVDEITAKQQSLMQSLQTIEQGEMTLDRRTGLPIKGSQIARTSSTGVHSVVSIIYSPTTGK
jgi:hypothetical protein